MSIKYGLLRFFRFLKANETQIRTIFLQPVSFLIPVKKNRIVFCNFMNGYTCNLKYIAEELIKRGKNTEIYWISGAAAAKPEEFPQQIKLINYENKKDVFQIASSARVLITNSCLTRLFMLGFAKKPEQIYINTWHGSLGIKKVNFKIGFYRNPQWVKFNLKDSAAVDYAVSNSDFETEIYKNERLFRKNIVLFGHPRNDIFFKEGAPYKEKIKKELKIPENTSIILYVPSFRDDIRTNCFGLDYLRVIEALEKAHNRDYCFVVRFHPHMISMSSALLPESPKIIDATLYPDIQELLAGADIAITDYSSCIFDFMLSKKPAFFYAEDIEKYNQERGFYFPMKEAPFPLATTTDGLIKAMLEFNNEEYLAKIDKFLNRQGAFEDGHASERVADLIEEILEK